MARILWIIGFAITFLLFGGIGLGVAVWMIWHHHFTMSGVIYVVGTVFSLQILWAGYRFIVLKRSE